MTLVSSQPGASRSGEPAVGAVMREPCRSCPWRTDQTAADIPRFSLELAERLGRTCGEPGSDVGLGAPWFACHKSRDVEVVCAGWLAAVGGDHLGVRLAVVRGSIPAAALRPGHGWPAMHESFAEVIAKLRATAADRNAGPR